MNYHQKIIVLISSLMMFSNIVSAQSFLMSSIGVLKGTSCNSTSVNFNGNANCINVQSGIAAFSSIKAYGEFAIDCSITQKFNGFGLKVFPNPTRSTAKAKFFHKPPFTENFIVSIWNTEGELIKTRKETGFTLFQGVPLDLNNLLAGSYVLKVESMQFVDAVKFIKVN